MRYYAGLDVSMKETFICILDKEGGKVYESHVYTDPKHIYDEFIKSGYELEKVGIESGSLSSYLTKGLQALGIKAICIDARKMAAILSVTVNKTDKNDARGIADAMRCNHYKEVNLRDSDDDSIGILLKSRATLVNTRRLLKNTVRGYLKNYGIRLGTVSHKQFPITVCSYYPKLLQEAIQGIEGLLQSYKTVSKEIEKMEESLKKICKQDKEAQLLMTVPGVGMIVALTFKADIGDPTRFKKSESVGAYYGMTPRQYSSGETVRMGGISRCGAKEVRTLLTEAAITLLTRSKSWSSLKVWGLKLMRKYGLKKAAMAVGRKLSVILHRILMTGESFKYGKAEAKVAA
jgi:transposase